MKYHLKSLLYTFNAHGTAAFMPKKRFDRPEGNYYDVLSSLEPDEASISELPDSPLGTLSTIPAEIRASIFRYVVDVNSATSDYSKGLPVRSDIEDIPDRTAILRTSKALHEEASVELWRTSSFLITTECSDNKYEYSFDTCQWEYTPGLYLVRLYVLKFGFFQTQEEQTIDQISFKIFYEPRSFRQQHIDQEKVPVHLLKSIQRICIQVGQDWVTRDINPSATTRDVQKASDEEPKSLLEQTKAVITFAQSLNKIHILNPLVYVNLLDFPNGIAEVNSFLDELLKLRGIGKWRLWYRFRVEWKDQQFFGFNGFHRHGSFKFTPEFLKRIHRAWYMPAGWALEAFDGDYLSVAPPKDANSHDTKALEKRIAHSSDDRLEDGSLNIRFGGRLA